MRNSMGRRSGIVAHRVRIIGIGLLVSVMVIASLGVSHAQSLTWLGTLPDKNSSAAKDVSMDGRVVVGWAGNPRDARAFRWENGVMQNLGTLPGME